MTHPSSPPAPMTAEHLRAIRAELDTYSHRSVTNLIAREMCVHIDALTARVSRLLEAVEGAEKALAFIAAHKGKTLISTEHGSGYSHGANAGFEQLANAAEDALATLRAAREVKP